MQASSHTWATACTCVKRHCASYSSPPVASSFDTGSASVAMELQWLPIPRRIQFMLCTIIMYGVICPRNHVRTVANSVYLSGLRSAQSTFYVTPWRRSSFGGWAFRTPERLPGTIPFALRIIVDSVAVRKQLKTYFCD